MNRFLVILVINIAFFFFEATAAGAPAG